LPSYVLFSDYRNEIRKRHEEIMKLTQKTSQKFLDMLKR